jgi:DNA replication protein DnaC
MRALAPELLLTAQTQRWAPEELLRNLIEAEIAAQGASNTANWLRSAAFPMVKTVEKFDVAASTIPPQPEDYGTSLEWVHVKGNLARSGAPTAARPTP